ncbi:MAG: DUF1848 domain-containing protein [Thermodesulfobacteriota bacterium]
MTPSEKIVISASRRTDIPAFYMDWFMARLAAGHFEVVNPYNGNMRRVPAGVDRVHTIVFWSKNFQPFLDNGYGEQLTAAGYHLFFNFTVNSEDRLLEPGLPPLDRRTAQLSALAKRFGPRRIVWRFDPVCFYSLGGSKARDNLGDLERIADAAAGAGVTACITSFMDFYRKIERRAAAVPGFAFIDPGLAKRLEVICRMESILASRRIALSTCCEKELMAALPPESTVRPSSCVPGNLFMELDGGAVPLGRDPGQRRAAGCGCTLSMDIGGYREQPCFHNCLFCYANPAAAGRQGGPGEG